MLKNFLMKQMLKSQMKHISSDDQDKILALIEKNPELFKKIGEEIQEKMKGGKGQMEVAMEVMKKHEEEIRRTLGS